MDQPLASFEVKEKYLLVIGHGKRDNLKTMAEAAAMIVQKAIEVNRRFMLVDYRRLEIELHMSEAFNIVKGYESHQPELKNITVAAVFDSKGLDFGNYWKDISTKRGFRIEIFDDIDLAEQWLLKQVK
ncbi:MAG TPA: hypothetical protein VK508_14905 [Cyclobacteriaceae bacterium]|nr:hypothetical protein [Cyclobacteriaceae bacterium]